MMPDASQWAVRVTGVTVARLATQGTGPALRLSDEGTDVTRASGKHTRAPPRTSSLFCECAGLWF